ncbi:hypothetical protein CHS0354_011227 [Potamilus streckersoni]|uniref:Mab-21-like HhH/H2TH-like domain-containing protein n=1 Tax=Potamilus streckersoni TaxID=2493646 RepID=A0AAE0RN90_9BIVA|nr:hypothetical protein CHS0354_011227 [Potamilus streckersoni]
MTLNVHEHYKEVSLRLNRVLDTVGLGEDIRWKRINMWIQTEEIHSVGCDNQIHSFGSQAEATTTPGLNSDIDYAICSPRFRIVKDLDSWVPGLPTLLTVSDESTHQGYVKLQYLTKDQPRPVYHIHNIHFKLDKYARSVLCNDSSLVKYKRAYEHHGPATRLTGRSLNMDFVTAMRLHAWPDQASQWLTRNRRHNWPSQETIGLIQQTGVLLVPVGHTLSEEKHQEWRLSTSYGEKLLMWLFNSTQYKCYILLKMINKCFIKTDVGDDVLSSYHCKTCMFYIIEKTPTAMWRPDNLLLCIELCLRLLYRWIESANCPNYFIPEENMFECKVYGQVQYQLLGILRNLLGLEGRYLVGISCDNIGQKLLETCQTPLVELDLQSRDVLRVLLTSVIILLTSLKSTVRRFLEVDSMFEHETLDRAFSFSGPRREANAVLMKFSCSILGSKLASQILSQESIDQQGLAMAHQLLLWGSSSDVASGKLKLAAFYMVQDNLEMSEDVLNEIHEHYSYKISNYQHILQAILSENLSTTQLISQYTVFHVVYHPSEINCTPKALILEMFRSTMSNQGVPCENYLQNLVRVDPKFYLYFLEFACHHRQNKRSHKEAALENMICVIRDEDIDFKDTALNLLAYCLMKEGKMMNAYNILCKSMKLRKLHNGAKWQMAILFNVSFRFIHRRQ